MERISWILIILALLFALVAVVPWAIQELSLTPGTVPPGWQVVDTKVIVFPYSLTPERLYDAAGFPTDFYGYPIDRSGFPFHVYLENLTLTIIDTYQDAEGCALVFSYLGRTYKIYVYRPSGRTYPAEIDEGTRIYIIDAVLPERSGEWKTAGGQYFYGFKRVSLSLARKVG